MSWIRNFIVLSLLGLLALGSLCAWRAGGWQALVEQDPMAHRSRFKERALFQLHYGVNEQPLVVGFYDSVGFYGEGDRSVADDHSGVLDFVEAGLPGHRVRACATDGAFAPDFLGLVTEMQREGIRPHIALVEVNLESFFSWSPGPIYSAADRELALKDLLRGHPKEPLSAVLFAGFYAFDRRCSARRLAPLWAGASHRLQSTWQRWSSLHRGEAPMAKLSPCGVIAQKLGPSRAAPGRLLQDLITLSNKVAELGGQTAFVIVPMDLKSVDACDPALAANVDSLSAELSAALQTSAQNAVVADLHRATPDGFIPGSLAHQGRRNRQWLGLTMAQMVRDMEQNRP